MSRDSVRDLARSALAGDGEALVALRALADKPADTLAQSELALVVEKLGGGRGVSEEAWVRDEQLLTQRIAELEAEVETLRQQLGEVVIVAIYDLEDVQKQFTEFMETGPEEGIEEKFRDLVHDAVLSLDDSIVGT